MADIVLDKVSKSFPDGTVAVQDVDLEIADGEFLVLLGPSGSGKTTLMRLCAGLEEPTAGSIFIDGEPVNEGKYRFTEINIEKRLRRGKLKNLVILKEAVEAALAQQEQMVLEGITNGYSPGVSRLLGI